MRVVIAGQGYVGLPLAVRAVECGHDVVGFGYRATTDPAECARYDVALITVPTPPNVEAI